MWDLAVGGADLLGKEERKAGDHRADNGDANQKLRRDHGRYGSGQYRSGIVENQAPGIIGTCNFHGYGIAKQDWNTVIDQSQEENYQCECGKKYDSASKEEQGQ